MAKTQKKSMFSQLIEKRSLDDRRFTTLNGSRWKFGYQVFRAYIGKIILLNLMLLVSALYLIIILLGRQTQQMSEFASAPFSQNLGLGYMPYTQLAGLKSDIVFRLNILLCQRLPLAGLLLGIGLSGGLYVMRNMLYLEDVSVFRDFFKGIVKNYGVVILTVIYSIILSLCILCISYADHALALGNASTWHQVARVICYIASVVFSLIFLHAVVMTVTYKTTFFGLFKNSFLVAMMIFLIPVHAFILVIAVLPVLLMLMGGLFMSVGLVLMVIFGFSYMLLVWTNYCHWIYEKFLSQSVKEDETQKVKKAEKAQKAVGGQAQEIKLETLPVKPFTEDDPQIRVIPSVFTLKDIEATESSIENMKKDSDVYYENNKISK